MSLLVHLLTYNGAKYLPYLFASLRGQTFKDWRLLILDNASTDNTVQVLKKELENFGQPWQLVENKENVGFAKGHNKLFYSSCHPDPAFTAGEGSPTNVGDLASARDSSPTHILERAQNDTLADYILLLNQDTFLAPDYLQRLVEFMDAHPEAGAAQGALLRWNYESGNMNYELGKTDIIDALGLKVLKNRRVMELGKDQKISDFGFRISDLPQEVFGVSGTLPIYRHQALKDAAIDGQFFDEDFFSYKEDVDLAYRLRGAGWRAYLLPAARAWHDRSSSQSREKRGAMINYYSYRNHWLTLLKNEYSVNFLRDALSILWYEKKKFIYLLFFERGTLKAWKDIWRLWPKMRRKRAIIRAKRKISASELRAWFLSK